MWSEFWNLLILKLLKDHATVNDPEILIEHFRNGGIGNDVVEFCNHSN